MRFFILLKTHYIYFVFVFFSLLSCGQTNGEKKFKNITFNSSLSYDWETEEEQQKILLLVDNYFSENAIINKMGYWNDSNFINYPNYLDLFLIEKKTINTDYIPSILSTNKIDSNAYNVRIAWLKANESYPDVLCIYNIIVNDNLKFENSLNYNKSLFLRKEIQEITFIYRNEKLFNENDGLKLVEFNQKVATFFNLEKIKFQFILFENYQDLKKSRGYDFDTDMFLGINVGGEAYTNLKTVFGGNGSAYYPHEVIHLYTNEKFKTIHEILDEGIATFLGGTQDLSFKETMDVFYSFVNKNDINLYETIFVQDQWVNMTDRVSLHYAFGALLCHIVLDKYNKDVLFQLMNRGKDDEQLLLAIEKILNVERNNLDNFIRKELNSYIKSQTQND